MTKELYHPVLDCFLRGLPHRSREVGAAEEASVLIEISGDCGGTWVLSRSEDAWRIAEGTRSELAARVTVPQEIAWRVLTKGIDRNSARKQVVMEGERSLAELVLGLTAIVG